MTGRVKNIILKKESGFLSLIFLFCVVFQCSLSAQSEYVIIQNVIIVNNHKTKSNVIIHEIDIKSGDTISLDKLSERMLTNERRLKSIGLFNDVNVNIKNWNMDYSHCDIEISVIENWFIYPFLIFELADRNFNVWRKEFNYSLRRVNYGIAGNHINLSGNKDKLKLKIQGGYIRKLEIFYEYPYLWKNWGLTGNVLYAENREIPYISKENKPVFFKSITDDKVQYLHKASIGVTKRVSPHLFQNLRLEFTDYKIDQQIAFLNPNYLGFGKERIRYFYLGYELRYDQTEYPLYPINGYRFELIARKEGLGIFKDINNSWISLNLEQHFRMSTDFILSSRIKFKTNIQPNPISYIFSNALGYKNDFITGYQLYVMDGKHFMLTKHALRYRLMDKNYHFSSVVPDQFKRFNVQLYGRLNLDAGYSFDPDHKLENPLSNKIQFGYGPGIDLILYNNFIASIELGITRQGNAGIFFSAGFNF